MHTSIKPGYQRVAHRGGAALAPENTMAAFRHARSLPVVDAIEFDVQMSRDGYAVVFHDETLERLTNGQGNMLDLDLAYLRDLNVAARFSGGWPEPQHMPLLEEVLNFAHQTGLAIYLEIKASRRDGVYGRYEGITEAVVEQVVRAHMLAQTLIMSFDWEILPRIQALAPQAVTAAIVSEDVWNLSPTDSLERLAAQVRGLGCAWINMDYELVTPEMPAMVHRHGLRLGTWTVNDAESLQRLASWGVDALTTDRPDLFLALFS